MLAKKNRLNLSLPQNSLIFQRGASSFFSSRYFLAYTRENKEYLHVACLAPKAVFRTACDRNKYRRLLYLLLEDSFSNKDIIKNNFSLKTMLDIVIVIKRNFVKDELLLKDDFLKLCLKFTGS